jgi:hypothetical protein
MYAYPIQMQPCRQGSEILGPTKSRHMLYLFFCSVELPRSRTFGNAPFTSSRLVLYSTEGPHSHTSSNAQFTSSDQYSILLKGHRSHTCNNAPFISSQLVLYVTEGALLPYF